MDAIESTLSAATEKSLSKLEDTLTAVLARRGTAQRLSHRRL